MAGQQQQKMDNNQKKTDNQKSNSPPMAVLPLNSSAKLDQEPNPFEQSFSGAQISEKDKKENKLTLPPVASITSPSPAMSMAAPAGNPIIGGGVLPKEVTKQFTWDSLRTGPLSPSMLQGPATVKKPNSSAHGTYRTFADYAPVKSEHLTHSFVSNQRKRSTSQNSDDDYSLDSSDSLDNKMKSRRFSSKEGETDKEKSLKKTRTRLPNNKNTEDDEKRKNFLERNRIAALKCRQRKKQWLTNLQAKVEFLTDDNERLQSQSESLKEEIVNLKTLLLAHKECPVAISNGFHVNSVQKAMPSMLAQHQSRSIGNVPTSYIGNRMSSTASNNSSSNHSIPQYQNANIMPTPQQSNQQQSMIAGGARSSSGVLRF